MRLYHQLVCSRCSFGRGTKAVVRAPEVGRDSCCCKGRGRNHRAKTAVTAAVASRSRTTTSWPALRCREGRTPPPRVSDTKAHSDPSQGCRTQSHCTCSRRPRPSM